MYRVCIAMALVFKLCAWTELFSEKKCNFGQYWRHETQYGHNNK